MQHISMHIHRGLPYGSQDELATVQPSELRVLVVDSKSSSRQLATQLLRESHYQVCWRCAGAVLLQGGREAHILRIPLFNLGYLPQVTALKTAREALQLLARLSGSVEPPFDLILKEHEPPQADACRMMRKLNQLAIGRIPLVGKHIWFCASWCIPAGP